MTASIFTQPYCYQEKYVAIMLGYDPNSPDTWPRALINHFISHELAQAERRLSDEVSRYLMTRSVWRGTKRGCQ